MLGWQVDAPRTFAGLSLFDVDYQRSLIRVRRGHMLQALNAHLALQLTGESKLRKRQIRGPQMGGQIRRG